MITPGFDAIVGHQSAIARLGAALADQSVPHALLIAGPDRVGKSTLAKALAVELLGAREWPGGLDAHPDFWCEDSDAERIGIDRVRSGGEGNTPSLQDFLALRSYTGGVRVAVLARAERMTEDCANALLKTLEEPPAHTHIVLTTNSVQRLPETVISRCQLLALAPVTQSLLEEWLTARHGIAPRLATIAASLAVGRPGRALWLAREPGALAAEIEVLNAFIAAAGGGVSGALSAAAQLAPAAGAEGRERALLHLGVVSTLLRDVVCAVDGCPELITWSHYRPVVMEWAQSLTHARAVEMLAAVTSAITAVSSNAQPRLTYEVLFLDLLGGLNGTLPLTRAAAPDVTAILQEAPGGELTARATTARDRKAKSRAR